MGRPWGGNGGGRACDILSKRLRMDSAPTHAPTQTCTGVSASVRSFTIGHIQLLSHDRLLSMNSRILVEYNTEYSVHSLVRVYMRPSVEQLLRGLCTVHHTDMLTEGLDMNDIGVYSNELYERKPCATFTGAYHTDEPSL